MPDARLRLITVPISHFCEKARWGLDRLHLPYREEPHAPVFHYPFTLLRGGKRTVPVLVSRDGVFADSTDILQYADRSAAPGEALYPSDPEERRRVVELEEGFDAELGPATRLWGYFHLLPDSALAVKILAGSIPPAERAALPWVFPAARTFMGRAMGLTPAGAKTAIEQVGRIFSQVEALLADGRRYLVGGRFSAADLTFASLSAPVLGPEGYGSALPSLEELPSEMATVIRAFRERPAGQYALRLFREDRRPASRSRPRRGLTA